eukprot:717583-Pelagomonas_calceolata.AAC.7
MPAGRRIQAKQSAPANRQIQASSQHQQAGKQARSGPAVSRCAQHFQKNKAGRQADTSKQSMLVGRQIRK